MGEPLKGSQEVLLTAHPFTGVVGESDTYGREPRNLMAVDIKGNGRGGPEDLTVAPRRLPRHERFDPLHRVGCQAFRRVRACESRG